MGGEPADLLGSSATRCVGRVVGEGVHGVEAKAVDVVVDEPVAGVVDEEPAHLVAARRRRG